MDGNKNRNENGKELASWLTLALMPGVSSRVYNRLLQYFGSPGRVLDRGAALCKAEALSARLRTLLQTIHELKRDADIQARVEETLDWQSASDCAVLSLACRNYPRLLREIADPPPLIYVQGNPEILGFPQVAMIGSRKPSPGGRDIARRLARELAGGGFSICSGMALGIDAASHEGALQADGRTLAVLGSGLDRIYPRQNRRLAARIRERGALLTEFPLGSPPEAWHFPRRNRIISGLSQGVLVVEAALRSGSLITARTALEQGREVFAVPGSIHNPASRGCHHLLKSGAKLVESAEDVVEELGSFLTGDFGRPGTGATASAEQAGVAGPDAGAGTLDARARTLLASIDHEPRTMDKLLGETGLDTASLNALLTELEIAGLIEARAGGYALTVTPP